MASPPLHRGSVWPPALSYYHSLFYHKAASNRAVFQFFRLPSASKLGSRIRKTRSYPKRLDNFLFVNEPKFYQIARICPSSVEPALNPSIWQRGWDSNPRYPRRYGGFQDRCLQPLGHLSMCSMQSIIIEVDRDLCQEGCMQQPSAVLGFFDFLQSSHVGTQYLRDEDAPIFLLIVFHQGRHGSANRQA